jgi:tRNA (guanosine-2'-O-)-methyltransferase
MPTARRIYRVAKVIHQRQPDICIALDEVHDQHNLSAVLRSADATGVGHVIWLPDVRMPDKVNPEVSKGSEKWVDLEVVNDLKQRLLKMKEQGYKVAATHMASEAVDFRSLDYTTPWVIVMGNEQRGCTDKILEVADENIFLPMAGFVQSLNISVATAVILYEIQRQRQQAGMYRQQKSEEFVDQLYTRWGLKEKKYSFADLLKNPDGPVPVVEGPHSDGRAVRKILKKIQ